MPSKCRNAVQISYVFYERRRVNSYRNNCALGGWRTETGDSRRGIAEVCTTMESVFTGEDEASWDEKRDGLLCWATGDGLREREKRRKERTGVVGGVGEEWKGMIARSDYVFTRSGGKSGRENSLGSAVPRTAVRLFELCMDTACLQRVLFAVRDSDSWERRCTYDAGRNK